MVPALCDDRRRLVLGSTFIHGPRPGMNTRTRIFTYENGLLLLLGFSFGIAFFDRNAATILSPFIQEDLHLSNFQVGLLGSSLALSWAFGAYLIARWSDAAGARRPFLIAFLLIFSACSFLSGLSPSFEFLLATRVVMGLVEGPFLPICLAIMIAESSPQRRGINAGVMQNLFSALLGQSLAPLVFVPLAQSYNWRSAFFVAGVPGLLCALAVLLWVREPKPAAESPSAIATTQRLGALQMLGVRNILLCSAISICMVGWLIIGWTFLPTFLTGHRKLSPETMQWIMAVLGLASAASSFGAPAISDRLGRRPVMIAFCVVGMLAPLAAVYYQGSVTMMTVLMFVGWLGIGAFPLFMGIIPTETIGRLQAATAMGLIVCIGEVAGGFGITTAAGRLADKTSPAAPFIVMATCAALAACFCLFLEETAPVHTRRSDVAIGVRS
jgi:predicted MFS family arabinose efflux permease